MIKGARGRVGEKRKEERLKYASRMSIAAMPA